MDRTFNRWRHFLYADEGIFESTQTTQIQRLFDILTELFYRVGLCTNVGYLVIMTCQLCCSIGYHSSEAYELSMMGEVPTYQGRVYQQVFFHECNEDLPEGSLATNWYVQNGVGWGDQPPLPPLPPPWMNPGCIGSPSLSQNEILHA